MGQVDRPDAAVDFSAALQTLAADPEQKVQKMARASLERLAPLFGEAILTRIYALLLD